MSEARFRSPSSGEPAGPSAQPRGADAARVRAGPADAGGLLRQVGPADTKQICEGAFEYGNTQFQRRARSLFLHDREPPSLIAELSSTPVGRRPQAAPPAPAPRRRPGTRPAPGARPPPARPRRRSARRRRGPRPSRPRRSGRCASRRAGQLPRRGRGRQRRPWHCRARRRSGRGRTGRGRVKPGIVGTSRASRGRKRTQPRARGGGRALTPPEAGPREDGFKDYAQQFHKIDADVSISARRAGAEGKTFLETVVAPGSGDPWKMLVSLSPLP